MRRTPVRHIATALAVLLTPLWAWSMTGGATFVIDGAIRFTVGSGGIAMASSRRDEAGFIPVNFRLTGPLAMLSIVSVSTYGAECEEGQLVWPTLRLGLKRYPWFPWTARGDSVRFAFVPLWPVLLLMVPTFVSRWRAWRAVPAGHCPRCRYDLRALPGGCRCPECGFAPH